ncbi:hypothetical protein ONZ45_g12292 [Pleurotus djamor]|nr:hypothetical protein ONZ45_g12292 [Pleurotus djamor]
MFIPIQRNGHQPVTCTPSELDIATLLVSMNHSVPSPVVPPLRTNYTNTNSIKSEDTSPSSSVPNEQLLPPHHTINIYHYPNGSQVNDSNQLSSKLLTSSPDHITLKQTPQDPSFLGFSMAIDDYGYAKSEEPSERAASHHVSEDNSVHTSLPHAVDMESIDMYGDEDADGEYEEEDAEGEPDEEFNMDPQDTM